VIICPNGVIKQWKEQIETIFPDSKGNIFVGKEAFNQTREENKHKYLIINYDLLSQEYSGDLIQKLGQQQIDFFVLDETHFVKIKNYKTESKRRHNLEKLLDYPNRKNAYILGMSATPVINNLQEGISFLELVTGVKYHDVSPLPTINNAIKLFEKLSLMSVREMPPYTEPIEDHVNVTVDMTRQCQFRASQLKTFLAFEQLIIDAKIPEIVERINHQPTIIYTELVTGIIPKIIKAVRDKGYSVAEYTGRDHSGIERFKRKQVDVLVASEPASTGVDGLQDVCHNLIISGLPWTNARYQQLVGRLVRIKQENDVTIHIIKANINGREYDEYKWKRILDKRTLAECAVDGIYPFKNIPSPERVIAEMRKWLERMERGEISIIEREALRAEIEEAQAQPVLVAASASSAPTEQQDEPHKAPSYGDFTLMTKQMNIENSSTTHKRFLDNPEEWHAYHRERVINESMASKSGVIPRNIIRDRLRQRSKNLVIADFGCGEAQLVAELGHDRVKHSFDHIAINELVMQCDMKDTGLDNECIDVAVFSLSMKGVNWRDYIAEANRVLYHGGTIIIADTAHSINDTDGRLYALRHELQKGGFNIYSDERMAEFSFIEARKV
jgi:hypothetical protein